MTIYPFLKAGVVLSAAFCLLALTWQIIRTLRFGKKADPSIPSGSGVEGILYAFGWGMMPWAKESARRHLLTWIAGVIYHIAVFFALTEVGFLVAGLLPPPGPALVIGIVLAAGLFCGLGLAVKRLVTPSLRSISCPDDFTANILVDGLLLFAILALRWTWAMQLLFLWSIYLFLYIPFGKIRHCIFFFYTRILFGRHFGRRGVLPHHVPKKI
jgi:hypothetical protein